MAIQIKNKSKVEIGVVPTHLMFVGALAPDESGKLPRTNSGDLKIVLPKNTRLNMFHPLHLKNGYLEKSLKGKLSKMQLNK